MRLAPLTVNGIETWWQSCQCFIFLLFHLNTFSRLKTWKARRHQTFTKCWKGKWILATCPDTMRACYYADLGHTESVCLLLLWYLWNVFCLLDSFSFAVLCFIFPFSFLQYVFIRLMEEALLFNSLYNYNPSILSCILTKTLYNMHNNINLDLRLFKGPFFSNWRPLSDHVKPISHGCCCHCWPLLMQKQQWCRCKMAASAKPLPHSSLRTAAVWLPMHHLRGWSLQIIYWFGVISCLRVF